MQGWLAPEREEEGNPNLLGEMALSGGEVSAAPFHLNGFSCRCGHPVPRAELVWAGHEPLEFCHC